MRWSRACRLCRRKTPAGDNEPFLFRRCVTSRTQTETRHRRVIPRRPILVNLPTTLHIVSRNTSLPNSPIREGPNTTQTLTELLLHLLALLRGEELLGVVNELERGRQRGRRGRRGCGKGVSRQATGE
jgi:hypothetical protein